MGGECAQFVYLYMDGTLTDGVFALEGASLKSKAVWGRVQGFLKMAALRATAVGILAAVLVAGAAAPAEAQTMRALIVGISDYETVSDLTFCDADAIDMRDMLAADPMWNPGNITLLVDYEATKAAIQYWMSYYASVTEAGDTFLFFFSGHGDYSIDVGPLLDDEDDGMDEYLCPYDADGFGVDYDTMISDDELAIWLWDIEATQRIVIIDSCFAGGMTKDALGGGKKGGRPSRIKTPSRWKPLLPMAGDGFAKDLQQPQKPEGPDGEGSKDIDDTFANTYVIMACDDIEVSVEDNVLGHGLLTNYVLEAGYGERTDTNDNAVLSAEEIFAYLEPWVTSYWGDFGIGQTRQHPQAFDTNAGAEVNFMTAPVLRPITVIMADNLDEDPGWEIMPTDAVPNWEYGEPQGVGGQSGDPDPLTPYAWDPLAEEPSIYGFNLAGDYFNNMEEATLTLPPFDLTGLWRARLRFWRWLGVEEYYWDEAAIQVSIDGGSPWFGIWYDAWSNPEWAISDTQWMYCDYPLGSVTDFQSEVHVRWVMGPTDYSLTFCGWNIDDVEIVATPAGNLVLDDGTNITTVTYDLGQLATITALPPIGWTLDEWVGDVEWVDDLFSVMTTVLMNGNYSIQANLRNWFYLTVNNGSSPSGMTPPVGTTIPGGNTQAYWFGDVVQITSAAPPGQFTQWTGDTTTVFEVLNPVTTITMNADYTVTAEQTYSLTVINGTGDGFYNLNDAAPIVSTLPPGTFDQWTGDTATVANPFSSSTTILMDGDYTVAALGTTQYTLAVTNGTGSGTYSDGATVNISSSLPAGTFGYWAGNVGTVADVNNPSTTIVMTGNYSVTAVAVAPLDIAVVTEDNLDWVYQNTPMTLGNNGHRVRLQVNVLDYGVNSSVTITVAKVPGSGLGEVTIEDDPGGDPLIKYIVGSMRTDGLANCGDLTLEVTATGDVSDQDTAMLPFTVRPLGDVDGNGAPEPGDVSSLIMKLNGIPPGGYHDRVFDLDANGAAEPGDVQILINILNGIPVL